MHQKRLSFAASRSYYMYNLHARELSKIMAVRTGIGKHAARTTQCFTLLLSPRLAALRSLLTEGCVKTVLSTNSMYMDYIVILKPRPHFQQKGGFWATRKPL